MSVFVQEVLGLLRRNFVKTTLNPTDDYFQFVRKGGSRNQSRSRAGGFAPQGQALSISAGSVLCDFTGPNGLGRFVSTVKFSGETAGTIPMFWLKQGHCSWHSLKDSVLNQDSVGPSGIPTIFVGFVDTQPADLIVSNRVYIPKLNPGAAGSASRIPFIRPSDGNTIAGELDTDVNFTFTETGSNPPTAMLTVGSGVSSTFGTAGNTPLSVMNIHSNLVLRGEVYDTNVQLGVGPTGGNPPGIGGMLLRSRADGTVQWTRDSSNLPDLEFGELIIGYSNPPPAPGGIVPAVGSFTPGALGKGNPNDVLTAGGPNGFPSWQPNPFIGGSGTLYQIAMFTPDGVTISNSLMSQDGDAFNGPKPLTVTNGIFDPADPSLAGNFINTGKMTLLDVAQEASASTDRILCLFNDPSNPNNPENGQIKFRPANSIGVTGSGTHKRVPLWTPDGANLKDSLLQQSDDIQQGAAGYGSQTLTNDGNLIQEGSVTLHDIGTIPDNTQDQVLVRDSSTNIVKYRSALSIGGGVKGWDVVDPDTGVADWNVVLSNGYMEVATTPVNFSFRAIRPNNIINAQQGYFVFVAGANNIPKDYLLFTGVNGSSGNTVRTTWNGSIASSFVYIPTNLDPTGQYWGQGVAVKFHYILRIDAGGNQVIWWDACCEVKPPNECPISNDTNFITDEDTPISGLSLPSTDSNPSQSLTWTIVSPPDPAHGTLTQVGTNGPLTYNYIFTPTANFCGSGSFTWKTNDGICDSNIATTTYNVACKCDSPQFAVSNGVGNPCGAASSPPAFNGVLGSTYTWNGNYCDIDNPATDVTILVYTSTDGGVTWTAGFGPNTGTLTQDTTASTFVFNIPSVVISNALYKVEMCDTEVGCCSEYIFSLSLASSILQKYELQISSTKDDNSSWSRVPYALNTNLGKFGADSGPYNCNNVSWSQNWNTYMEQIYPSSVPGTLNGGYVAAVSTSGGGTGYSDNFNFGIPLLTVGPALTAPVAPSNGSDLTIYFRPENVLLMTSGGTGYNSNIPTVGQGTTNAGSQPGGGSDMTVTFTTGAGGTINAGSLRTLRAGGGYAIGDTGFVNGGNGNATWEIVTLRSVPDSSIVPMYITCPGKDYAVGDKFTFTGGSGNVEGEIVQLMGNNPGIPLWGQWGEVKGKILTDRSTVPTNMDTSGIPNNTSVEGISPSGGTYSGIAGGATFQLVNMVAELPNPNPGSREIFVFADQIPANSNINVGETIIFSAATLDTAFSGKVSAGFNFTGDLICTIQEEDISYKPLATSSIGMAQVNPTGHACNNGAYKMTATITDGSGARRVLTLGRYSVSNSKILSTANFNTTLDTWDPPAGFINSTDGREWTRAANQSTWGQLNYPYIVDKQYIDQTRRGLVKNQVNSTFNNNAAYINQQSMMGRFYDTEVTSGVRRIPQADIDFISSNSVDGIVDFKLIGDTWVNTHHNDNTVKTIRGLVPGTGYVNGTYNTVNNNFVAGGGTGCSPPSTGGFGCRITVATTGGGVINSISIAAPGSRYAVGDVLTIQGGNGNASVTVQSVGSGVDGTVKVTAVTSGGEIQSVITETIGDAYATYQGDDKGSYPAAGGNPAYVQTINIPAEFMATGGSGSQNAQIRCGILGGSIRNCGIVTAGQILDGTFTITNGGTGYQVGDILTISSDHTWVAKTHSDAAQFRLFHQGNSLIEGHVFNTIGGTNTGYTPNQNGQSSSFSRTFDASGSSTGGQLWIFTDGNGSVTKAIVLDRSFPQQNIPRYAGQNFKSGDVLTINTGFNQSGTGNATITLTPADIDTNQKEIFNGAPYNNTGSANDRAFIAGDGTAVRVNIFTGEIDIV